MRRLLGASIVTLLVVFFALQRGGTLSLSLANNYLYSNIVKTTITQLKTAGANSLCTFEYHMPSSIETKSFHDYKKLKPLLEQVKIGDRRALGLAYLYHWEGHETNARSYVKDYLSTGIEDPIAWFLMRSIELDLPDSTPLPSQGNELPAWWRWGSDFFLSQGWCWVKNNRFDKAATHLAWYSQAAKREMDFDHQDLEKSRGLFTTLERTCGLDDYGCEFLTRQVEPLLIDLFIIASQVNAKKVRGEAHFSLAVMEHNRNGLNDAVLQQYQLAISNVPSSVIYRVHLGSTLTSMKQYNKAEQEFNIALENANLDPEKAVVLGQMGYLNLARYQYTEAAKNFEDSIGLDNSDKSYQIGLAQTYIELNRFSDTINILLDVVQQEPQRSVAWGYLGIAYRHQQKHSNAADALNHSVNLDPTNISFRLELAQILIESDRIPEAIEQYIIILEQDPSRTDIAQELTKLSR